MYENSGSFRDRVGLERYGINPGFVVALTPRTHITLNYEHFHDGRTADRGIPSYEGRPADIPVSTFFGNPEDSWVRAAVDIGTVTIERQWGSLNLRNRALAAGYDRAYQNYVPGAVNADQTLTALSAYNNATGRRNLFILFFYLIRFIIFLTMIFSDIIEIGGTGIAALVLAELLEGHIN